MRKGDTISVDHLGYFGMSQAERRKRLKIDDIKRIKRGFKKRKFQRANNYNSNLKKQWLLHCEKLKSHGLKPWRYEEWRWIMKKPKMKKFKKIDDDLFK